MFDRSVLFQRFLLLCFLIAIAFPLGLTFAEDTPIGLTEQGLQKQVSRTSWDWVEMLLAKTLTPVIVVTLGVLLKRGIEQASIRNSAIAATASAFDSLTSSDARERESALLLVAHLGEVGWGREMSGRLRTLLTPIAAFSETRTPADKTFSSWMELFCVPVSFPDRVIRTGTVCGQWVIFHHRSMGAGAVFLGSTPHLFEDEDLALWPRYDLAALCIPYLEDQVQPSQDGGSMICQLLGYQRTREGINIELREASIQDHTDQYIKTTTPFSQGLVGYLASHRTEESMLGIISGCASDDGKAAIISWTQVIDFVESITEE